MSVVFILILASLLIAGLFLAGFIWAVKSGQYDDVYTPAVRILSDEDGYQNETNPAHDHKKHLST